MNSDAEMNEARLLARLRSLPREREPAIDLWPRIKARLNPSEPGSPWWAQAVAAMLVAALGLAVLRIGGEQAPPAAGDAGWPMAWQVGATGAELEYSGALRDMRGLEVARTPAAVRNEYVASLLLVEEASRQVRAAIERNPEAGYLTEMLATLHRRHLGVLRDMALSSLSSDSALDIDRRA